MTRRDPAGLAGSRFTQKDETMQLFDSHSHLNEKSLTEEDRAFRIEEIEADEDLLYVMDIGYDLASSKLAAAHAANYDWCFAAVGYHPSDASYFGDEEYEAIKTLAAQPGVKAIGEIGLDYHYEGFSKDDQWECFRRQIRLANELAMPICIHARDADQDVMDILKEEGAFSKERKAKFPERPVPEGWEKGAKDARVVLHCFSGSAELARQYVDLGATISLAGPVTFKNARKSVDVALAIPPEFLLVETDAPYLAPVPMRGKPNRSPYVVHTARRIAVLKHMPVEELAAITCANAKRFYGID